MQFTFTEETNQRGSSLYMDFQEYKVGLPTHLEDNLLMTFLLHKIAELELRLEKLENKPETLI